MGNFRGRARRGGAVLLVSASTAWAAACGEPTAPTPAGLAFTRLSAGAEHTCGVADDGTAHCWGSNSQGQLGIGKEFSHVGVPVPVLGDLRFAAVDAGVDHTCGVTLDGRAACWGSNAFGQANPGAGKRIDRPAAVPDVQGLVEISAGGRFTCAVTAGGDAVCWGRNDHGQLGNGTTVGSAGPTLVAGGHRWSRVDAGEGHACGVTVEGTAACWGRGESGRLGIGVEGDRAEPVRVGGLRLFRSVTVGRAHGCGIDGSGATLCWGANEAGEVGDGSYRTRVTPARVAGDHRFWSVEAALGRWACALDPAGALWCWGGDEGLAPAEPPRRAGAPVPFAEGWAWRAVTAGRAHGCGLAIPGGAYCWGAGSAGQLGAGSQAASREPVRVAGTG